MSASAEFTNPKLVAVYDAVNPIDDKINFFVELANAKHAKNIIDLGCGTGLLSFELMKRGYAVVGVEPARAMLEQAKQKYGNKARWIVGGTEKLAADMRSDMTIMTGHVAQFFLEDTEWNQALRHIHAATKQGGFLVFESRNPLVAPFIGWPTDSHHDHIADTPLGPVEWWLHKLVLSGEYARYELHYLFIETGEEIVTNNALRFRTYEALQTSLQAAGFMVEHVYGDWNGGSFKPESPEMLFVATRL